MRCAEFERQLQELLDADPRNSLCPETLPDRLSAHSHQCANCEQLLSGYRSMFVGLAALSKARSPEEVITLAVPFKNNVSRTRQLIENFGWYAAAACIVMMVTVASMRQEPSVELAAAPMNLPVAVVGPSLVSAQSEAGQIAGAQPAVEQTVITEAFVLDPRRLDLEQASLGMVLNIAGFRPVTFSAEVLETHWNRQPAWMVEVADGLKPVTESMTGTLDALRRALPATPTEEPNQGARFNRYNRFSHIS